MKKLPLKTLQEQLKLLWLEEEQKNLDEEYVLDQEERILRRAGYGGKAYYLLFCLYALYVDLSLTAR